MNAPRAPAHSAKPTPVAVVTARPALPPVLVLGGGPIGLVCALLLARLEISCHLVDARPLEALQRDRRLLALSRSSLLLLEDLLGADFAPMAPITRVWVSSRGNLGSVQLGAADFDGLAVGATVWYADLVTALERAARGAARIQIQRPRRVLAIDQRPQEVQVELDDGTRLTGSLAIDAEGTPARAPAPAQHALLAEVLLEGYPAGDAIERFTHEGPLALLPVPPPAGAAAPGGAARMSLIWCLPTELANARRELPPEAVLALLRDRLGARYGTPVAIGACTTFALTTHRLRKVCEHRLVHLGNAAQSLHPVAGQGFNLGLRDCLCLMESLRDAHNEARDAAAGGPPQFDPLAALPRYQARRRADRSVLPALTSALPRIFSSTLAPVVAARGAALMTLDLFPGLRRAFTRLLMLGTPR